VRAINYNLILVSYNFVLIMLCRKIIIHMAK
jgi:hypothetical protein